MGGTARVRSPRKLSMPRRPTPSFDYAYLQGFQDNPDNPNELYLLSPASQKVLRQLAELVLWRRTRWYNGDEADILTLSGQIFEELNVPAHLDDLIPYVDDILALLEEIRDHEWCCDTIDSIPGGDDVGGVDDSTLPPDVDRDGDVLPPEWEGNPEGYDSYLCGQAVRLAESTDAAVDAIHNAILGASNVLVFATLMVLAFGNLIGMGIAAILAGGYTLVTWSEIVGYYSFFTELREALGLDDPSGIVPATKSEMASIADDIENAVFCANGASSAYATIAALVDGAVSNASYRALLKLLYAISLRPIFWGFGGAPDSDTCVCDSPYEVDVTFDLTVMSDPSWQGSNVSCPGSVSFQTGVGYYFNSGTSFCSGRSLIWPTIAAVAGINTDNFDFVLEYIEIDVSVVVGGGVSKTFVVRDYLESTGAAQATATFNPGTTVGGPFTYVKDDYAGTEVMSRDSTPRGIEFVQASGANSPDYVLSRVRVAGHTVAR